MLWSVTFKFEESLVYSLWYDDIRIGNMYAFVCTSEWSVILLVFECLHSNIYLLSFIFYIDWLDPEVESRQKHRLLVCLGCFCFRWYRSDEAAERTGLNWMELLLFVPPLFKGLVPYVYFVFQIKVYSDTLWGTFTPEPLKFLKIFGRIVNSCGSLKWIFILGEGGIFHIMQCRLVQVLV